MDSSRLNTVAAVATMSAGALWIGFTITGHVAVLLLGALAYAAGTGLSVAYVVTVVRDALSKISFEVSVDDGISRHT